MTREEIVSEFERTYKNDGMPPLAGKIIGHFYVTENKYLSFNEIHEAVGSSKGTVSKVLKYLIQTNRVQFLVDEDDKRKRFYYLDIARLIEYLKGVILNYQQQNTLLVEVKKLRGVKNLEMNTFIDNSIDFNSEMLEFLKEKSEAYFGQANN